MAGGAAAGATAAAAGAGLAAAPGALITLSGSTGSTSWSAAAMLARSRALRAKWRWWPAALAGSCAPLDPASDCGNAEHAPGCPALPSTPALRAAHREKPSPQRARPHVRASLQRFRCTPSPGAQAASPRNPHRVQGRQPAPGAGCGLDVGAGAPIVTGQCRLPPQTLQAMAQAAIAQRAFVASTARPTQPRSRVVVCRAQQQSPLQALGRKAAAVSGAACRLPPARVGPLCCQRCHRPRTRNALLAARPAAAGRHRGGAAGGAWRRGAGGRV